MSEEYIPADSGSEVLDRALLQVLTELPEDRSTPLDEFLVESLLEEKAITKEQLLENIHACKSSQEPMTLFATMQSRGDIKDSDVEIILKRYKDQAQSEGLLELESDVTFGEIAVEKKLTTHAELWAALEEQERKRARGSEHRLGEILVNRGTLTISQAKDVLVSQGKRILRCLACGDQYNVTSFNPDKKYTCLSCGGELTDTGDVVSLEVKGTAFEKTITTEQPESDRLIGREIGGCKILSKIGEGGMGAVYKAHHLRLKRIVAVKIMSAALLGDVHRKRFLREARAAAQLDHPNIMIVHDVDEFEGSPFIIMQYIDGKTVGEILDAKGKVDQVDAVRIILEAAQALDAAHQRNIVHRDIKPDNIMLTQSGQVKVMDFGLAKRTGSEQEMGVTATGVILGTPLYMSPEQFNAEVLDGRSDIYSLGVTFYHMVAGRPPFTGKTPYELRDHHMKTPPPSPRKYSPELSPSVCTIIDRMLAKNKENRYSSAVELVSDLEKALKELAEKPAEPAEAAKRSILKYVVPTSLAAAVVIILVLLTWGNKVTKPDPELERRAAETFASLKKEMDRLLPEHKFYECLQVLGRFPEEYSETRVRKNIDAERARVVQEAVALFERLLAQADQLRQNGSFEQAAAASEKILERLGKIEKGIHNLPEAVKVTQIKKKALDAEKQNTGAISRLKEFQEVKRQAEALIEAKNLAEAKQKIAHFTKDGIKSIQNQAKQVIAEIEQKQREIEQAGETAKRRGEEEKQERAGFKEAKQLAQDHIDKNEYDLAKQKIDLFAHSRFGAIRKDAEELLARIVSEEVTYREQLAELEFGRQVESELKKAEKALDSGNLEPAQEFIKKYENNARLTEGQKTRLVEINRRVSVCQRFEEDLGLVKQFLVNNEFKRARKILGNWLNSTEESIATRAKLVYERLPLPAPPGMVPVSGGTYTIGSRDPKDHNPQRAVSVGSFFIDKYEVTNTEYAKFVRATNHKPPQHWTGGRVPKGQESFPVTWVSYEDAAAFAKWAGKRLPTEEEWEIAAGLSGGKIQAYPWGSSFDSNACNINSRLPKPVGSFPKDKSPAGLFDMAGNVCEWTSSKDKNGDSYAIRGGDWGSKSHNAARTAYRFVAKYDMKSAQLGFRCAKNVDK